MTVTTPRRVPRSRSSRPAAAALASPRAAASDNGSSVELGLELGGGGKKYNMTLIAGVKGDEFYITMNCGAQAEAKKLGVTLNFQGPDKFDPSLQTPIVNAVAAKKPDAVLDRADRHEGDVRADQAAAPNGSKIVLVDTTLDQPEHGRVADRLRQRGRRQGRRRRRWRS